MNRRILVIVAGVVVLVIALLAIFRARSGSSAVPVRFTTVHYDTFRTKLPETGVVQLPHTVTIPAGVAANIASISVRAGERVRAGQVLATLFNEQISSNVRDAEDNALAEHGKVTSVSETNGSLPEQNRSSIVQAEAAVVAARTQLTQAEQDLQSGSQSGLGYGGSTAEEQRLSADTTLEKAATDLREAKRTYDADTFLFENKGVSRDTLMQSQARYEQAQATFVQAQSERKILGGTLSRETQVLRDRVTSAQDTLRQAEAQLAAAKATATESHAGDLVAARADANRADADLAYAQDQADHLTIRAPFDGLVESVASQTNDALRPLQPGDAVELGQALFTLTADDDFVVRTKVDEQDVADLAIGQKAIVSGEDFDGATLPGHVVSISPVAQRSDDPSNTARQVVTTIALEQRLPFLRDGMTVDVDIVTHREPHVLAVSTDAVRRDASGTYLFVAKDGRATRVPVTLGTQNDTSAVVTSGLHDGDVVIDDKNPTIVPGTQVTAAPSAAPDFSASPSSQ
jgi:RND family efflux transporter MFP subunit